jgi:hypothetical protein
MNLKDKQFDIINDYTFSREGQLEILKNTVNTGLLVNLGKYKSIVK